MSGVSSSETVLRVAAKGDGITANGRHVPRAAPGDILHPDGTLEAGPHRADPPCRHFPQCGGCVLQHLDEQSWVDFVRDRVTNAAEGQHIAVGNLAPTHVSPPNSRRRATLHAQTREGRVLLGFYEQGGRRIVDMRECHVLAPAIFAAVAPLRRMLAERGRRLAADIHFALADQGVDCTIAGFAPEGLAETEAMIAFAEANGLARLSFDDGTGPQTHWEPDTVTATLSGVAVPLPHGAFLQPTADGAAALVASAREWLGGARTVADLFAGLGTFAFALSDTGRVLAVEAARDAHLACKQAAGAARRPVFAQHRDLFRNPLQPGELDRFDAVLLDPPRAGAKEQVMRIAESRVARVCYISCNPASWARDAARLVAAGYRLAELKPVGQFRWSTHVELASLFVR